MSQWLQTVIQNHAQSLGIGEHHSQVLAETLLPALAAYRVMPMPSYIDDHMWAAAQQQDCGMDYNQAQALYSACVRDYTQRK